MPCNVPEIVVLPFTNMTTASVNSTALHSV